MSVWSLNGQTPRSDVRAERIAAGTVGGEHTVPRGLVGRNVTSIIDDTDPRITYGTYTGGAAGFGLYGSLSFAQLGTQTVIGDDGSAKGTAGAAAHTAFTGTSIGVMGSTNPYSGTMTVLIDGVVTPGRVPVFVSLHVPSNVNAPAVLAADATINTLAIPAAIPSTGVLMLGGELIAYSGKTSTSFTGCTRGYKGTIAGDHYANETVYLWDSSVDLGTTTNYGNKRLLYYNPFLAPGDHTITIYSSSGFTTYNLIYFDGFIVGSLLGSQNIFTQTGTITASVTTDGNGHCDIGTIVSNNSDVSIIGILGYSPDNTETSNTTPMAQLGIKYAQSGEPYFYIHNGPASTTFNVLISFTYIGESL